MEWINIIRKALKYIEGNLQDSNLCAMDVANSVNVSYGHFSRAFNVLTGITVSEYIRNRRLTVAGDLLKNSDKSVLEVSLDLGYETPEAFSKAFKRFHNVNPNESKKAELKKFYPMQINLTFSQDPPLSYTIEEKNKIILCGNYESVSSDNISTAMIWKLYDSKGYLDELYSLSGFENIVGVYYEDSYCINAIASEKDEGSVVISPHKWAVFKCEGKYPDCIDYTWNRIYSSWINSCNYKIDDLPQLEVYEEDEFGYRCEIWIPICSSKFKYKN